MGGAEYVQKAHGPKARGYKSKKKKEKLGSSPRYIVIKEVSGALRKDEVNRSYWATKSGPLMILIPARYMADDSGEVQPTNQGI